MRLKHEEIIKLKARTCHTATRTIETNCHKAFRNGTARLPEPHETAGTGLGAVSLSAL